MVVWTKDSTTRAPMVVYHRIEPAPDGLVRLVFNPADGGVVGVVYNKIGGQAVSIEAIETLLEAAGGLDGA